MKKWLGLLVVATFGFSAMPVFADDQGAVSAAKMAAEAQPVPVPQGDADQTAAPAVSPTVGVKEPINFGDYRSTTLTTKAWAALAQNDIESVLAYTNKCISLYGAQASKMQAGLTDYASGSNDEIFKYWALNDVATSYYIQAEAYRAANMKDEAKEAYNKLVKDYSFGQSWDPKGWFWKPAEAAKEKLAMMAAGVNWDFGDYSSSQLVQKAWAALAANDLKAVEAYANKTVDLYAGKAKDMQASLKEYPWESKEKTMSYWALNDVGTALFILGEAYQNAGKKRSGYQRVQKSYQRVLLFTVLGSGWLVLETFRSRSAEIRRIG
jgi:tetratricopeptide (TPR) repeat protein